MQSSAYTLLSYDQLRCCRVFTNAAARIKGERKVVWGDDLDSLQDIASVTLQHPVDRCAAPLWRRLQYMLSNASNDQHAGGMW